MTTPVRADPNRTRPYVAPQPPPELASRTAAADHACCATSEVTTRRDAPLDSFEPAAGRNAPRQSVMPPMTDPVDAFAGAPGEATDTPATAAATTTAPPAQAQPTDPAAALDQLKTTTTVAEKREFLGQYGVKDKHLQKASDAEVNGAFDSVMDALKKPGETKFKAKLGGKKYEAQVTLDAQKGEMGIGFKEKKGFFGKLWDGIKTVGKIALNVASFIPGPVGVGARVANAVIGGINAIKNGNILEGVGGLAGAVAGGAGAIAGNAVGGVARTVANVAGAVQRGAQAAQGVIDSYRQRDWGGLLGSIATGASNVAGALGNTAGGVQRVLNGVADWATRAQPIGEAVETVQRGDLYGGISQGAAAAADIAGNGRLGDILRAISAGAAEAGRVFAN